MTQEDVIDRMRSTGLIAACYPGNEIATLGIIKASYKGGLRVFEMKHHREDRSFYLFKRTKVETASLSQLVIGAGGVPNAATAEIYLKSGAQFILSPFLKKDMAAACHDRSKLWIPGCADLRDIEHAVTMGAQVINILTSQLLGVKFFREVHRQFPNVSLIPSGGITAKQADLIKWYSEEILCIRMPDDLYNKESAQMNDWSGIELQVFSFMQRIKRTRASINTFIMKGEDDLAQKD